MVVDGIWPPYEAFYIESMFRHTASAQRSIKVVGDWLDLVKNEDKGALDVPKSVLFEQLQNILHQAGCISRYYFPSGRAPKPLHRARAIRLRQAFGVEDHNPLAERGLRNAIEHFDERLDEYLSGDRVGEFIPEEVGYSPRESEAPLHIFKGFYTYPMVFVLLGKSYEMAPIVDEILRLHNALQACVADGCRLPLTTADSQVD